MGKRDEFENTEGILNRLAKIGAGFDWITPGMTILRGLFTVEMDITMDQRACNELVEKLKSQGYDAKTDFVIDQGWRVISNRKVR